MRSLEKRIVTLEHRRNPAACLNCELGRLTKPMPPCRHSDGRSLAQELRELNAITENTHVQH
jgi:hypothetical protein